MRLRKLSIESSEVIKSPAALVASALVPSMISALAVRLAVLLVAAYVVLHYVKGA